MKDTDLAALQQSFLGFIRRFHSIIFFTIIGILLMVVVLSLSNTINLASEAVDKNANALNEKFDETTIDRIEKLKDRTEVADPGLPKDVRISPFVEYKP